MPGNRSAHHQEGTKMKKSFAVFLGLALAAMCQFALAAPAVVSDLIGTAQAVPESGATRVLRDGDSVNERDTIQTAANSGLVLRFEDGQIAAIGANSRMTVSAYSYDVKEPAKGNVLLSLLTGSMRAITGLIGKASPQKVAFRAGTATIGIRGTDVSFAVAGTDIVVTVVNGAISFTVAGGTPIVVTSGNGALLVGGKLTQAGIAAIEAAVQSVPGLSDSLKTLKTPAMQNAVSIAAQADAAAKLQPVPSSNPSVISCGASCN
jgi:hypothetical protein